MCLSVSSFSHGTCKAHSRRAQVQPFKSVPPLLAASPRLAMQSSPSSGRLAPVVFAAVADSPTPEIPAAAPETTASAAAPESAETRKGDKRRARSGRGRRFQRNDRGRSDGSRQRNDNNSSTSSDNGSAPEPRQPHPHAELCRNSPLVAGRVTALFGSRLMLVEVDSLIGADGAATPLPPLPEGVSPLCLRLMSSQLSAKPVLQLRDYFAMGDRVVAQAKGMVVRQDDINPRGGRGGRGGKPRTAKRTVLSTLDLERQPGDVLANPAAVFAAAAETLALRASGQLPPSAAAGAAEGGASGGGGGAAAATPLPEIGSLQTAEVTSVSASGAELALDGFPGLLGLLRRTHISVARVASAADVLAVGHKVPVVVAATVGSKPFVLLDMRVLEQTPGDWVRAARSGTPYTGVEAAYAAWRERQAKRDSGSESERRERLPDAVEVGQEVQAVALAVNEKSGRARASVVGAPGRRAFIQLPAAPAAAPAIADGDIVRCVVRGISEKGVAQLDHVSA